MPDSGKPPLTDPRREMFRDLFRKAGAGAADVVIGKLERAGQIWGQEFVPTEKAEPGYAPPAAVSADHYDRPYFRPPGAIAEAEFMELCSTCRKCVDACPVYCIVPAQAHMGAPVGTPILFPNDSPCTLCGDCMDMCPSGALLPIPPEFVRIGLAHIVEQSCIAHGSEHCTLCHEACPTQPNSVVFSPDYHGTSPTVDAAACTGCGLCVPACPTDPKSIEVRLRPTDQSDSGDQG